MKGKRRAAVICGSLMICALTLHLPALTASAADTSAADTSVDISADIFTDEGYTDVRGNGTEAEVTIGVGGYVQLPSASENQGTADPKDPSGADDNTEATAAKLSSSTGSSSTAAPKTGDEAEPQRFLLQLILAGLVIGLALWQGRKPVHS